MQRTSYLQSQTIVRALEFALSHGGFDHNARQKKSAQNLVRELKSNRSVSGRHQLLIGLLKKGTTISGMMKAAGASRRTIFRYLNHFEDAGLNIRIENGRYRLK